MRKILLCTLALFLLGLTPLPRFFDLAPTVEVTNRSINPASLQFHDGNARIRMGHVYPGRTVCLRLPRNRSGVIVVYSPGRRLLTFSQEFETSAFDGAWTWEFSESDLRRDPPTGLLFSVSKRCSKYKV